MPPHPQSHDAPRSLRGIPAALFRMLLPHAEREEVLQDLTAEHAARAARDGTLAARIWLWRQLLGSLPALGRRVWWRGWTGFEPRASRLHSGGHMLESWIMDVRYSARRLVSRPSFAVLAVVTLALGAGGTAAIFSVVRTLLLDPLPVARESEIGVLWMPGDWNEEEFLYLRPGLRGFQNMAAIRPLDATLEMPGEPLRLVRGVAASSELFDVLGRGALLGRTFRRGDDVPGAEPVAVLSYGFWQALGGSSAIIGRQLRLGGVPRTIVGVMPPGFWFPDPLIQIWTAAPLSVENRSGNYALVGRVARGMRVDRMDGPLQALAASLGRRFEYPPQWDKSKRPGITPLREHLVGDVRPGLLAVMAAMALILLTACVNVTALVLGQISRRNTELAVRVALGAGRRRLLQQLVAESLLIGLLGGITGALIAAAGFQVLVRALPLGALADTAVLDWRLFWAAMLIALLSAVLIGAVPGVVLWRGNLQGSLATIRTAGMSGRGGRLEGGLVIVQIALAMLLATGAALLIRSVANLRNIDTGLRPDGVAVLDATMPTQLSDDERRRVVLDFLPALQGLPNVRAAAATLKLPLRGTGQDWGIEIEGRPDLPPTTTYFRIVSRDYFRVLGMAIRRGRGFLPADRATTERVVVINEALAAKYFPGEDPVGRIVHTGFDERGERVVGVVQDVAEARLTDRAVPARYMLYEQVPLMWHEVTFVLSAAHGADLGQVIQAARTTLQRDGRQLALQGTVTMQSVLDEAVGAPRHLAVLLSMLAALALLLGAVGVYGTISHFVTRRTREYGIRIALGQRPALVVSEVMARGLRLVAAGSVIGVLAAVMLTRLLSSLLYGVQAADPAAVGGAALVLLLAGSVAAFVPARRASRTDPALVLRDQ